MFSIPEGELYAELYAELYTFLSGRAGQGRGGADPRNAGGRG